MISGVPQGPLLGPILFTVSIADIELGQDVLGHAFVDDNTISHACMDRIELNTLVLYRT